MVRVGELVQEEPLTLITALDQRQLLVLVALLDTMRVVFERVVIRGSRFSEAEFLTTALAAGDVRIVAARANVARDSFAHPARCVQLWSLLRRRLAWRERELLLNLHVLVRQQALVIAQRLLIDEYVAATFALRNQT